MEELIRNRIEASIEVHRRLPAIIPQIQAASALMTACIREGGKILFAGNGGSAGDAQHLAGELVNRFLKERRPLAGISLTTDTSVITAIANDYAFDEIFAKQVQALGVKGDVFFGISTSGNSPNLIRAFEAARALGLATIGLTGAGGRMADLVDCLIAVPEESTPRIQEAHITIGHILCEIVEARAT